MVSSVACAIASLVLVLAPVAQAASVPHCARFVKYNEQTCASKLVAEKDECDCETLTFNLGAGQRCDGDGLFRGRGMEAHDSGKCDGFFECEHEYCHGVTCSTVEKEDTSACAACSDGYEFAQATTVHTYTERTIGELCDDSGGCTSGFRKGAMHPVSTTVCTDKLMYGHSGEHTYWCEKETTQTVAAFTTECRLTPIVCGQGQLVSGRQCATCPAGQFQYQSEHELTDCIDQKTCKAGQLFIGEGPSKNGKCSSCPAGTYQPSAEHRDTLCTKQPTCGSDAYLSGGGSKLEPGTCEDHPSCSVGQYYTSGNPNSAGKCSDCQSGKYQDAVGHQETSCDQQVKCDQGQFMLVPDDAVKAALGVCTDCPVGEYQGASNFQGTVCKEQSMCIVGQIFAGDAKVKGECVDCIEGEYQPVEGPHQELACLQQPVCDATANRVVLEVSTTVVAVCICMKGSLENDDGVCTFPATTTTTLAGNTDTGGGGDAGSGTTDGDGTVDPSTITPPGIIVSLAPLLLEGMNITEERAAKNAVATAVVGATDLTEGDIESVAFTPNEDGYVIAIVNLNPNVDDEAVLNAINAINAEIGTGAFKVVVLDQAGNVAVELVLTTPADTAREPGEASASTGDQEDEKKATPMLVVIVVAGLLIVILSVLMLLFRQKKEYDDDSLPPIPGGGGFGMNNPMYKRDGIPTPGGTMNNGPGLPTRGNNQDDQLYGGDSVYDAAAGADAGTYGANSSDMDTYGESAGVYGGDSTYGINNGNYDQNYGGDNYAGGNSSTMGSGVGYLDVGDNSGPSRAGSSYNVLAPRNNGGGSQAGTMTSTGYGGDNYGSASTIYAIPMEDGSATISVGNTAQYVSVSNESVPVYAAGREVVGIDDYDPATTGRQTGTGASTMGRGRKASVYGGFEDGHDESADC